LHGLISSEWILDSGILRESQPDASLSASVGPKAAISERPSWFKLLLSEGDEIIDEPLPRGALLTRIRRATDAPASASAPLLEVGGLSVKRGVRSVIGEWDNGTGAALTFTLFRGEICILQAPNGWGKSTLLDAISGLIPSRSKFLRIEGASIANLKPWKIREAGLNYIPATRGLFPSLSVSQTAKLLGNQPPRSVNRDFSAKAVGDLSGGQLQAVKFSTTKQSCHPAKILCMDEPFNALDKQTTEALAGQLMQLPYDSILLAIPTASQAD
jgi:ABC-type branched-subunit amino acid transport system ATPase component